MTRLSKIQKCFVETKEEHSMNEKAYAYAQRIKSGQKPKKHSHHYQEFRNEQIEVSVPLSRLEELEGDSPDEELEFPDACLYAGLQAENYPHELLTFEEVATPPISLDDSGIFKIKPADSTGFSPGTVAYKINQELLEKQKELDSPPRKASHGGRQTGKNSFSAIPSRAGYNPGTNSYS